MNLPFFDGYVLRAWLEEHTNYKKITKKDKMIA